MSKIGDLIVRLRLRHEDYEKGLKDSERRTDSFAKTVKQSWTMAVGKVAAVTAAIVGVVKVTDKVVHHSQAMGDAWDRTMSGMKSSWDTFLNGVATGDLSGIFTRMVENAKAAQDFAMAVDAIGEAQTASALVEAQNLSRYQQLMEKARDVNQSTKERIAAVTEMKNILTQQNSGLILAMDAAAEKAIDVFILKCNTKLKQSDITSEMREQVKGFLIWMGNQGDGYEEAVKTMTQIESLNKQMRDLSTNALSMESHGVNAKPMRDEIRRLEAEVEKLTQDYVSNGGSLERLNLLIGYNSGDTEEARKQLEQYVSAAAQQSNAVEAQTARFTTLQNSLLSTVKSTKDLIDILPALGDGFAEAFARETSPDFVGPMSPDVKKVVDIMNNLGKGGGGNKGGKTQAELYADNLSKMRGLYEQHDRWKNSFDLNVIKEDKALYANLSQNGATYLEFLQKEREKYLNKTSALTGQEKQILTQLNDEISKLTQWPEVKIDDTPLKEFDDTVGALIDDLNEFLEIDFELPSPDPNFETFEEYEAYLNRMQEVSERCSETLRSAIVDSISGSIQYLADSLMGLEDISAEGLMNALLQPLAQAAVTMGGLIMMEGLAALAFQQSLGNPYAAIAAGAALMVTGAIASAGLKAAINKATGTNAGGGDGYVGGTSGGTSTVASELTIYVKGRLSGSDIVLSGQKTLNEWSK